MPPNTTYVRTRVSAAISSLCRLRSPQRGSLTHCSLDAFAARKGLTEKITGKHYEREIMTWSARFKFQPTNAVAEYVYVVDLAQLLGDIMLET